MNSRHQHARPEVASQSRARAVATAGRGPAAAPAGSRAASVLALQRKAGNRVTLRVLGGSVVHRDYDTKVAEAAGSTNSAAKKVAAQMAAIAWPGPKPDIQLVPATEITTTAFYDVATHVIKANRDEADPGALWDNILFEAQNALNQQKFKDATKKKGGGSSATPTEYGREYASIEFDTFMKYVDALKACGLKEDEMSAQAKAALAKAAEYGTMSREEAEQAFINAPHMAGASGKAGLSSADLYAYEAVEGWEKGQMASKVTAVMREVFNAYGGPTSAAPQAVRAIFRDATWPAESAKRPAAFHALIDQAIAVTDKPDMKAKLATLKLSGAAQTIAAQNA